LKASSQISFPLVKNHPKIYKYKSDERLEREVAELKATIKAMEGDVVKLLCRQIATQAVNKLARVILPDQTAYDVRWATVGSVKDAAAQEGKMHLFDEVMNKYPRFKAGVKVFCNNAYPIAHPLPTMGENELKAMIQKVPAMNRPAMQDVVQTVLYSV
jgi:hypothetical protein